MGEHVQEYSGKRRKNTSDGGLWNYTELHLIWLHCILVVYGRAGSPNLSECLTPYPLKG